MEIHFKLSNIGTRKEIRDKLVRKFLEFPPELYETIYLIVENEMYLTCPGQLNKGIDFVVNANDPIFNTESGRRRRNPSHDDILNDLRLKKNENTILYKIFLSEIESIFECTKEADTDLVFSSGISSNLLIKLIKWLFIEQDITYWTKSGRKMFMDAIRNI
jgi:hypothetical protein